MCRIVSLWITTGLIILGLLGCGVLDGGAPQLEFLAPMNVDSSQRWHVSLGVKNVGDAAFRTGGSFNGEMNLRNSAGAEIGRIQVATLWALDPDEPAWPASYSSQLAPGAYTLTWRAPDSGGILVDFSIVELEGWRYLGEEWIRTLDGQLLPDEREYGALQSLVGLARVNLAQRLNIDPESIAVEEVIETEFNDASLGVPEADQVYAQVLTPGYIIRLVADGPTYTYHASNSRLVFFPGAEDSSKPGQAAQGSLTITGVQVVAGEQIVVRGESTLPDGTCLGSELWADGVPQPWWPGEDCIFVEDGTWQMVVPLGTGEAPATLDATAQYVLRAFQQGGPNIVSVLAFDLSGPAMPPTPAP